MMQILKEHKLYLSLGFLGIMLAIYFLYQPQTQETLDGDNELLPIQESEISVEQESMPAKAEIIIVDVKGAVINPGVYEAQPNDRVYDLIIQAGGLAETADEANVNFAMRVEDEMVIYVPKKGEEIVEESNFMGDRPSVSTQSKEDGKVNINTANESELQTLPGIGPSKASAIIEFREINGPFKNIEEIKSISGIGDKTFEKLKNGITVK